MIKSLLLVFSLSLVIQLSNSSYAVKECYQCEYFDHDDYRNETQEKCKDAPIEFLSACSGDGATEWQCVKVTGRIELDEENYNYIKRACLPGKSFKACKDCKSTNTYQTEYGFLKKGKHCVCDDKDGCNGSTSLTVSLITVFASVFAVVMLKL